jgi:hypothetical protein
VTVTDLTITFNSVALVLSMSVEGTGAVAFTNSTPDQKVNPVQLVEGSIPQGGSVTLDVYEPGTICQVRKWTWGAGQTYSGCNPKRGCEEN